MDSSYGVVLFVTFFMTALGNPTLSPGNNATVFIGQNASIYCQLVGVQGQFDVVQFRRLLPLPAIILSNNDVLVNTSTMVYTITDKYRLNFPKVEVAYEGTYGCNLGLDTHESLLTVLSRPENVRIYFDDEQSITSPMSNTSVSCDITKIRPEPTVRWFKGSIDISNMATQTTTLNATGFADTVSTVSMNLTEPEEGTLFRCMVDLPDNPDIAVKDLRVAFSSASSALLHPAAFLSLILVFMTRLH